MLATTPGSRRKCRNARDALTLFATLRERVTSKYLDEVFIRIQGVQHYLWRAVDQNGVVLDILVQGRRDANAATRFFRRLLAGLQYVPRVIVTDKLTGFSPSPGPSSPPLLHGSISSRR